ncbi:hypothetical protein JTB14_007383 [Gonioctena quinquepunctata]|nr:hypothetical protein JTB14_007383 [Gonioctena quinquepunctata]
MIEDHSMVTLKFLDQPVSTTEAKYRGLSATCRQAMWISYILLELRGNICTTLLSIFRDIQFSTKEVPNVHYSSQPTATSFMSSRKPVTYYETKPTPTQSPTGAAPSPSTIIPDILSPNLSSTRRGSRKSVKFGDSNTLPHHNGSQLLDPWSVESKSPILVKRGVTDTSLLIGSGGVPVTQLSVQ